jgi:hypothetical protein
MDQTLSDRYGTAKDTIKTQLQTKRQEQRDCNGVFSIKNYEKEYPDYPVFLHYCRHNDEEAGDRVAMEMAQRVTEAMSREVPGGAFGEPRT